MAGLSSTAVAVLAFQLSFAVFIAVAQGLGFAVDLIHRDSPDSPFHSPMQTEYHRLTKAYHRSLSRFQKRSLVPNLLGGSPYADIVPDSGEYLMKIQIGTPPVDILADADSGSDLIWIQCQPCIHCYPQIAPIFNPIASSTYKDAPCGSSQCQAVNKGPCDTYDMSCFYGVVYGNGGSVTTGTVGIDTLTLQTTSGQPIQLHEAIIGCGHNSTGSFPPLMTGIVGLGWGPSSLVSQMGDMIQGLFSYCFGPTSVFHGSKINFGANAIVSGAGTLSTPLFNKNPSSHYFLILDAVSVNDNRIETSGTSFSAAGNDGNIIIDSGTTFTFFPQDFYSLLEAAVTKATTMARADLSSEVFKLCYNTTSLDQLPKITMHFRDADLVLDPQSAYLVDILSGISCFGILGSDALPPLFGNVAQQNFLVGYDTFSLKVSFKSTDCHSLF